MTDKMLTGARSLQRLDIYPAGWRVSHIEHKLSISSGVGVTIAPPAGARIDTSFNGLVAGRVASSSVRVGRRLRSPVAVSDDTDATGGLVSTSVQRCLVGGLVALR